MGVNSGTKRLFLNNNIYNVDKKYNIFLENITSRNNDKISDIKNNDNFEFLNLTSTLDAINKDIEKQDIDYYNELLNQPQEYINEKLDKYLSENSNSSDENQDNETLNEDINFFKAAIKSIETQTGKTIETIMQSEENSDNLQ